jgi:hypothetical protein
MGFLSASNDEFKRLSESLALAYFQTANGLVVSMPRASISRVIEVRVGPAVFVWTKPFESTALSLPGLLYGPAKTSLCRAVLSPCYVTPPHFDVPVPATPTFFSSGFSFCCFLRFLGFFLVY